jgi:GGDEF domain-containing protein
MRLTLGTTIALMGVLGLGLALATGEIYRQQTLEDQRDALKELVQAAVSARLRELEDQARTLGFALQAGPGLQKAFAGGNRDALVQELENQLRQNSIAAKVIKIDRVVAYDTGYRVLGGVKTGTNAPSNSAGGKAASAFTALLPSMDGEMPRDGRSPKRSPSVNEASFAVAGCPQLIERARQRAGAQRMLAPATLCLNNDQVRYSVLVPVGGPAPRGYLEVVANPAPSLAGIESRLGFPMRIRDGRDRRIFVSKAWPPADAMHDVLVAEHLLTTAAGLPVIKVAVMRDVAPLQVSLGKTRWLVFSLAIAATLLGVVLAFYILEKTTLQPLNILTQHLRRVGSNKDHLGEQVAPGGLSEIRELAEDFNQMARELDRLYGSLEYMAFTDPLTNLPNRTRFRDSLEESVRQYTLARQPFALFLMDLDRFKAVNDSFGHQVGDLLLQEAGARLRGVLRESDTVARLDNETIVGLDDKMVARLGGDEFAAILPRLSSIDDASAVARKLLLSMQEPFPIRGHLVSIGISIGIALYPQHGEDIDTLMQRADTAMYFAKNNQSGLAFPNNLQQTEMV